MQWLNKVDDALDWVLGPVPSGEEGGGANDNDNGSPSRAGADAVAVAVATVGQNNDANNNAAGGAAGEKPRPPPPPPPPVEVANTSNPLMQSSRITPPPPPSHKSPIAADCKTPNKLCEDGIHCPPPVSVVEEETEDSIRGEAEATIEREVTGKVILQQNEQMSLSNAEVTDEVGIANENDSADETKLMQDFASRSPAPTKVTIGEREKEAAQLQLQFNERKRPPPPPPIETADENEQRDVTEQQKTQQNMQAHEHAEKERIQSKVTMEPPSPSTLVVQLTTQQASSGPPTKILPPHPNRYVKGPVPPPPLGMPPTTKFAHSRVPVTPSAARNQPRHSARIPRPRATPGVIRRRLREPSPSPPESPIAPTEKKSDAIKEMETPIPPLPLPVFPTSESQVASTVKADGAADISANAGKETSIPPTPPQPLPRSSSTAPIENHDRHATIRDVDVSPMEDLSVSPLKSPRFVDTQTDEATKIPPPPSIPADSDASVKDLDNKSNGKRVSYKNPVASMSQPQKDFVTPVIDNRKTILAGSSTVKQVVNPPLDISGKSTASSKPSKVEKALDLMLGHVLVKSPAVDADDANAAEEDRGQSQGGDSNTLSNEDMEPKSDSYAGWLSQLSSNDGGGQKAQKKKNSDDDSDSDSFHTQELSKESELTGSDEIDDFIVPPPTFSQLEEKPWDQSLNCYGFIHVRLLRAQRLPCTSGSSITATLSLQPWKGRIRIPSHITAERPDGAGVCLRWDKPYSDGKGGGSKRKRDGSKDGELQDDNCSHSMVHAYNSEETPVPTILLELSRSSLGVFDRFLCSVSIPCHDLFRNPREWTEKWHPASINGDGTIDEEAKLLETVPLILLQLCFEPKKTRFTVSTLSDQMVLDNAEEDEEPEESEDDTLGSIPHIIRPDRQFRSSALSDAANSLDDESISKSSMSPPILGNRNAVTKSHLLRVRSFWTPSWCSICEANITTGWTKGSFECEACHIFCCRDCQVQVDAKLPCGSELASIAVKKAEQYKIPSVGTIMTTLAPQLDTRNTQEKTRGAEKDAVSHSDAPVEGIATLKIRVLKATLFDRTYPSEAEPAEIFEVDSNFRNGDYYVRVSWLGSNESKRTKTVLQTSRPVFDSEEMTLDVPHYSIEYKLEVVDANTDKPIGSCLLSAQGLLQSQRDELFIKKDPLTLFRYFRNPELRRVKVELRTHVKDGFGLNFYSASKVAEAGGKGSIRPGEISGWLELDVYLKEDRSLFYSATPRRIPPKPDEEFDIALIQLHISRIGGILERVQEILSAYQYLVSWENPKLTGASMTIFIAIVVRFNIEYLGSLPIGTLTSYMMWLGYLRYTGHFKDRWTMKERLALIKSETQIEKNQSIARPVGLLSVGDLEGKHLRSRDLGLPGSFYVCVLYDPLRYADEKVRATQIKLDSANGCTHEIGATVSPGITSNPVWSHLHESSEFMRLKHLLPDDRLWREEEEADSSLSYPILQPITDDGGYIKEDNNESTYQSGVQLMPFESSLGAVVFQVRFSDVLGSFQLFDNVMGEVVLPISKLALSGRAVEGWFRLLPVGTKDTVPGESRDEDATKSVSSGESTGESKNTGDGMPPIVDFPELYLRAKFSSNGTLSNGAFQSDVETSSKVICEELSRTAEAAQDNSVGVIGTSLNTINTVRTLGGKLQNQISYIVDMLERVRNAFNFSNPRITFFILLCLILVWIVLALVPTRLIVLFVGLAQYGATFVAKYIVSARTKPASRKEPSSIEGSDSAKQGNPIENLFLSIPTDEDLRRAYFWETRRLGEKEREKFATAKRQLRLEKLWKATWHGALELREKKAEHVASPTSQRVWNWEPAFGLIEGHRFIWWRSEKDFDKGEAPLGQIFFAGHSGLAGLSPLDLRELSHEEIPFVVSVFGRGSQGQQKITLLLPSAGAKSALENAVLNASMGSKAD